MLDWNALSGLVDTPAMVLDRAALDANIATMAAWARQHQVGLRPHAKTHKSVAIGRRQVEAGAIGLCCAKLGEAEILAAAGVGPLLVTSALRGRLKIERLLALAGKTQGLMVVVDDVAHARELGAAFAGAGLKLDVLIDTDVGTHRFGVTSTEAGLAVADAIAANPALRLRGIQGYAGSVQHIEDADERRRACHACLAPLQALRDALRGRGNEVEIVTGSGTGSHFFDVELDLFTDFQVGSYVCSDVEYNAVRRPPEDDRPFESALFVASRVVSAHHKGFVTTDAGSKCFSLDGPMPAIVSGAPAGSTYTIFGDEFGRVTPPTGTAAPTIGTLVACIVPHCDPTINMFDRMVIAEGGRIVDEWPIDARGAAS